MSVLSTALTTRDWRVFFMASLGIGLIARVAFVGTPGFPTDVQTFQAWAERLREVGPGEFYAPDYFSDYPPAYLYVLWIVATLLGGMPAIVVKALSIPFDLAIAIVLYAVVARVVHERAALIAASLYLLNPALVLAGPYWGQVDAAGTLPLLLALVAAAFGRFGLAGALGAIALMVKPQFGLGLAVVLAAAAFDLVLNRRVGPLARALGMAVVVVVLLALPFRMTLSGTNGLLDLVGEAAATYEYTTLYAFNLWAVVSDFWKPDDQRFLGLEFRYWSALLFGLAILGTLAVLWRGAPRGRVWGSAPAKDLGLVLATGSLLVLAFYFLPTRVHERYLFPFFALAAPLAAVHGRVLWTWLGFAMFFFFSLLYAFTRYPQTFTAAPDVLESTLYQRPGTQLLSLIGMALAAALAWWWARGEERDLIARPLTEVGAASLVGQPAELPAALRPGRGPMRRDVTAALILALLVLLTRGYRLDWPRDMYFDEVYHARTAMEMLAGREYYEWTHPHLAKEAMAISIALFANVRATGATGDPPDVEAYAVAGDGARAYARAGVVTVVQPDGRREDRGSFSGRARAIALLEEAVLLATDRELALFPREGDSPSNADLPTTSLGSPPRALAADAEHIFVATADQLLVFASELRPALTIPLADVVALQPITDRPLVYAATADGAVRSIDHSSGATGHTWQVGARVATLAVLPQGCPAERAPEDRCDRLFLSDASAAILHQLDLESGVVDHVPLENARTAPFRGAPYAIGLSPRTRLVWVLGPDGLVVVDSHGVSPFAIAREAAGGRFLGLDDANDAVIAGGPTAVSVAAGRVAFAWRFPGVVASAILAFFLYLLARRLFAAPHAAYALGALLLVDGAMFAQARIGMNDVYAAAGIVAGWYFVAAALSRDARRPWLSLLLAGTAFGVGLAAKWAAGPAILAVGLVSLFVTLRAFAEERAGQGGPLDLLARRGANALYLALCFVLVPLAIYFVSYIPWLGLGHELLTSTDGRWSLVELQRQMYTYHSQLTAPHPAGSPWWAWPLDLKPVYWEYEQASPTTSTYIYNAGNLITWWAAIPALVWFIWLTVRTAAWNLAIVVLAFATQYLEWIPVTRVLFQYHFFTALPFYLLALAAAIAFLWEHADRRRWIDGVLAVAVFVSGVVLLAWVAPPATPIWIFSTLAAFAVLWSRPARRPQLAGVLVWGVLLGGALWFVWFYPWLSAVPIPGTLANYYFWLPTWQYGCQFYPSFRCA